MHRFISENRQLLILCLPLMLNYFVEGCPNFINNVMIAHLGQTELAAGAIVSAAFSSMVLLCYGILASSGSLIALYYGAKQKYEIGEVVRDAMLVGLLMSLPFMILLWYGSDILAAIGQPPALVKLAQQYLHGLIWAVIPDFISMVLWQFFIALGQTRVSLISCLLYVPLNIGANFVLMFGHLGFPALGMMGIGLGTALGFSFLALGMLLYLLLHPSYKCYFSKNLFQFKQTHFKSLFKLGLPMGLMWMIDLSFMMIAAILVGKLSTVLLAAQQICIQAMALILIIMSGFSQALIVRVGHTWGAKDYASAKIIYQAGLFQCLIITLISGSIFWFKPLWIIGLDFNLANPNNKAVIQMAEQLLFIFGFYQMVNSFRYVLFGVLRALKDTFFSAILGLIAFYGIGLGLGYPLLFHWNGSLTQFWTLMIFTIFCMVLAMDRRYNQLIKLARAI